MTLNKQLLLLVTIYLLSLINIKSQNNLNRRVVWSLEECLEYAIANNITVKKAILSKNSSDLNLKQSKNNRLPNLNANINGGMTNGSSIDPITSSFQNEFYKSVNGNISTSVALYNGNKLTNTIEQNQLLVNQNSLYIEQAENNIILSILEAYVQALYTQEAIEIAKNSAKSTEDLLKQGQIKFSNGALSRSDLADLEAQNATNQYNIVSAQTQYAQQVLALKQLLELDPKIDFQIEIPELSDSKDFLIPNKEIIFEQAVNKLPDTKIYDLEKQINEKDLEIAKAGYLPTLNLSGSLSTGYSSTRDYIDFGRQLDGNKSQNVSLSLNIPIFSKFQNKTNVALAKINIQQSELNKIQANKDLYQKIEMAWLNATTNQAESKSSKTLRDTSKLSYDLSIKKYEFGGSTTTDLLVSQTNYLNAEQKYLQTKYMGLLYQQLLQYYQGQPIKIQ
ncbi:TolC family protein [Apibacter muscae]|uniref:TolC family protein n=1 Tax=Apibacter muscae TaxID=2509004 RepID=A0A563D8M8_9FLAO|nr:TolC family protein [Apibacter muscae]TWP26555.1 TolC family protein [Apibacter muscae]TWP28129.1 TolC family protein [Apibacter muscae]